MKVLSSFLLLVFFAAAALAQRTEKETGAELVAGKGLGVVSLGAKRKTIEEVLEQGENRSKYEDVYFVDYPKKGIQISYTNKTDEAYTIFFYNNQKRYENFVTPAVRTDKGITWSSTPEEVIKAYGKPENDFKDESGNNSWRRLEYKGIDFLYQFGEMKRIGIHTEK
jgi:hypothetical protein